MDWFKFVKENYDASRYNVAAVAVFVVKGKNHSGRLRADYQPDIYSIVSNLRTDRGYSYRLHCSRVSN